jgi:DNA-binding transcriptional MerR regulator
MTPATAKPGARREGRLLTIGSVCRSLKGEFPDISISKIRYLEDQGLLTLRRTQGGYRLFSADDVERLETILRLQRDEFLPLRVIREALDSPGAAERRRRRDDGFTAPEDEVGEEDLLERAGINAQTARELESFGLLAPRVDGGERLYAASDVEIAATCARLSRFGIAPRHLRAFRTAVDREVGLIEAVLAPSLRARTPEKRRAALEDAKTLAGLAGELRNLLFLRELRKEVVRP